MVKIALCQADPDRKNSTRIDPRVLLPIQRLCFTLLVHDMICVSRSRSRNECDCAEIDETWKMHLASLE